jgi:hypothetical protein
VKGFSQEVLEFSCIRAGSLKGQVLMKLHGLLLSLVGAALLVFSLLADMLRIGCAPLFFGWKQVLGVTAGTMLILYGFIIAIPRVEKPGQ